jgi:hypothetical protein
MLNLRLPHPRRLRIGTEKGQKIHGRLQAMSGFVGDSVLGDVPTRTSPSEVIFRVYESVNMREIYDPCLPSSPLLTLVHFSISISLNLSISQPLGHFVNFVHQYQRLCLNNFSRQRYSSKHPTV